MIVGLIPLRADRAEFDSTMSSENEETVELHGLPKFFLIDEFSLAPPSVVLLGHFAFDWAVAFGLLSLPIIILECIRITAFYAARAITRRRHRTKGKRK